MHYAPFEKGQIVGLSEVGWSFKRNVDIIHWWYFNVGNSGQINIPTHTDQVVDGYAVDIHQDQHTVKASSGRLNGLQSTDQSKHGPRTINMDHWELFTYRRTTCIDGLPDFHDTIVHISSEVHMEGGGKGMLNVTTCAHSHNAHATQHNLQDV